MLVNERHTPAIRDIGDARFEKTREEAKDNDTLHEVYRKIYCKTEIHFIATYEEMSSPEADVKPGELSHITEDRRTPGC